MNNENYICRVFIDWILIEADEIIHVRLEGMLASAATDGTVPHV